jgi:hypothetical protein
VAYPFEIAIDPGATDGEISVRVLNSLIGEPSVVARLDVTSLATACQMLEQAVRESRDAGGPGSPGEQLLRDVGRQLFDAVFSGEVGSAYRASYAVASERSDKLRLVLRRCKAGQPAMGGDVRQQE